MQGSINPKSLELAPQIPEKNSHSHQIPKSPGGPIGLSHHWRMTLKRWSPQVKHPLRIRIRSCLRADLPWSSVSVNLRGVLYIILACHSAGGTLMQSCSLCILLPWVQESFSHFYTAEHGVAFMMANRTGPDVLLLLQHIIGVYTISLLATYSKALYLDQFVVD